MRGLSCRLGLLWQSLRPVFFRSFLFATIPAMLPLVWPPARQLEYEYALLTAWGLVFLPALAGVLLPRSSSYEILDRPWREMAWLPFFAMIPGLIMWFMGQCPCGIQGFQFWMLILAGPAAWIGFAIFLMTRRMPFGRLLALSILMLGVLWTASTLWFFPQKRVISVVAGFLHGPIYDRWIPVDWGVILARMAHGFLAVGAVSWLTRRRSGRALVPMLWIGGSGILWLSAWWWDTAGFGAWFLNHRLSSNISDASVEVHYERRSARDEVLARDLTRDAQFHVEEIAKLLDVTVPHKIKIFAYRDNDQKKLLFGGGNTDVTDVWTPSVHIELRASPHPTLRHELVHAVASFASWHGLGFHPNMVITEGLAMALAPTDDPLSFDQITAQLVKSGRVGDVTALFSPLKFWMSSGVRSYVVAGSLLRWIHQQYGASSLRRIYQGDRFEAVAGVALSDALGQWQQNVLQQDDDRYAVIVERLSRDPGVLGDRCPHTSEDLLRPRSEGILTRLRQPFGWDPDQFYDWRLRLDPGDREAGLARLKLRVRDIMMTGRRDPGEISAWHDMIAKSFAWPPKVTEDLEAAILLSDFDAMNNQGKERLKSLEQFEQDFAQKNPGPNLRRQWEARVTVEKTIIGPERDTWRSYLAGWSGLPKYGQTEPWIVNYLRARRESQPGRQRVDEWIIQLRELGRDHKETPEIYREWLRMAAIHRMRLEQHAEAIDLFDHLAGISEGESKLLEMEHARRARYFANSKK